MRLSLLQERRYPPYAKWLGSAYADLGRPEAALVGVQFFHNDEGEHRGAWIVRKSVAGTWIFAGTKLRPGSRFADGGIEADSVAPQSPAGTEIVAAIPNLFGTGQDAHMAYYETRASAKVFAAGAFTLADAVWWPDVRRVMENLWARLQDDGNRRRVRNG